MTKILLAAAEAVPFIRTGALGDTVGLLARELAKKGNDVKVVLPGYRDIPSALRADGISLGRFAVPVGWRRQDCSAELIKYQGAEYYLLGNDYYFDRLGVYGYHDDAERYAFFCRAVLELITAMESVPDIINYHDWHTGMIGTLMAAYYAGTDLVGIKKVFTIHNPCYQGSFDKEILSDLFGLDWSYFHPDRVELSGQVNFTKAGIVYADAITTISPVHAAMLENPSFGEKLDEPIRGKNHSLYGIINGIDLDACNPAHDGSIAVRYDARSLRRRRQNKLKLQHMLNLRQDEEVPLIVLKADGGNGLEPETVEGVIQGLLKLHVQLVVLGGEQFCLPENDPVRFAVLTGGYENMLRQIYAGADIYLSPYRWHWYLGEVLLAMRYGSVPVVFSAGGLKDIVAAYNEDTGEGNGFSFTDYDAADMLEAAERAAALYKNHKAWSSLVRSAMKSYGVKQTAEDYQALYRKLTAY